MVTYLSVSAQDANTLSPWSKPVSPHKQAGIQLHMTLQGLFSWGFRISVQILFQLINTVNKCSSVIIRLWKESKWIWDRWYIRLNKKTGRRMIMIRRRIKATGEKKVHNYSSVNIWNHWKIVWIFLLLVLLLFLIMIL